jgi:hypothetical protein
MSSSTSIDGLLASNLLAWNIVALVLFLHLTLVAAWRLRKHIGRKPSGGARMHRREGRCVSCLHDTKGLILWCALVGLVLRCIWLLDPGFHAASVLSINASTLSLITLPDGAELFLFKLPQLVWLAGYALVVLHWRCASEAMVKLRSGMIERAAARRRVLGMVAGLAGLSTPFLVLVYLDIEPELFTVLGNAVSFAFAVTLCVVGYRYGARLKAARGHLRSRSIVAFVDRVRATLRSTMQATLALVLAFCWRYAILARGVSTGTSQWQYLAFLYVIEALALFLAWNLVLSVDITTGAGALAGGSLGWRRVLGVCGARCACCSCLADSTPLLPTLQPASGGGGEEGPGARAGESEPDDGGVGGGSGGGGGDGGENGMELGSASFAQVNVGLVDEQAAAEES